VRAVVAVTAATTTTTAECCEVAYDKMLLRHANNAAANEAVVDGHYI
jgi:hypothetical protein